MPIIAKYPRPLRKTKCVSNAIAINTGYLVDNVCYYNKTIVESCEGDSVIIFDVGVPAYMEERRCLRRTDMRESNKFGAQKRIIIVVTKNASGYI